MIESGTGSSCLRSGRRARLLLSGLLLWGGACTDAGVTIVEVARVTVEPSSVSLVPGEARQLQATAHDGQGRVLQGRSVQWSSSDPAKVSVTPDGRVTGLTTGSATIRARSGAAQGTSEITVSEAPAIHAEPDSVRLETVIGGAGAEAVVTITNGGGGSVSGLGVTLEYSPGAAGWAAAVLSGSSAPATLRITADATGLSSGTWKATARLTSTSVGAEPVSLPIVLDVRDATPQPTISAVSPAGSLPARSLAVRVTGSGFATGVTAIDFGAGVVVDSVHVQDATSLTAHITVASTAAAGLRDVTVTNAPPGGGAATLVGAFRVLGLDPAPAIQSVAPAQLRRGRTAEVAVTGSGFVPGVTTVSFGADVSVGTVTVTSASELIARVTAGAEAMPGTRTVTVTNPGPGGGSASLPEGFRVVGAVSPARSSVTADPGTGIPANGTAASIITVLLRDEAEGAISGLGPDAFDITVTGSAAAGSVSEDEPGRYQFAVTNTVAETITVAVKAEGTTLSPAPAVQFVPVQVTPAARIVTFGDSNTDYGYVSNSIFDIAARSYVSNRAAARLAPADPNHPNQLAGLIEARWADHESTTVVAVNHGIGGTSTGTGQHAGTTAPNARKSVDGVTRYEAEVLGRGYPWSGGETNATEYPDGAIVRVKAFTPGATDFAYVSMGTNDPTSGLTPEQTIANLTWMVDTWLAAGHAPDRFIITTLAPRGGGNGATFPQINAAIRALATARGIKLVDLAAYTSEDDETWKSPDLHIGDALHYTVAVRDWIAQQVVAHMRSVLTATGVLAGGS